jgi:RimJ/RimL family protein N-acetyltransferase
MAYLFESERLGFRELSQADYPALCAILQDEETMYAYAHAFSDAEAQAWLDRQLTRYREDGFGLWAVILKQSGRMIGQCGLSWQDVEGEKLLEIGYLFNRAYWHNGYAAEAAAACRRYAFETLGASEVCSIIRDSNLASINVAIRNGMLARRRFVKRYYDMDMPHIVFSVKNPDKG